MSRGVDVDVICFSPAPAAQALRESLDGSMSASGLSRLNSIDDLLLDELMEWILPGQRCVAITEDRGGWQFLYDTEFNKAALADALSIALPDCAIVQFNLQEETDLTLRVLRGGAAVFEYSNAPSFFNWGRCIGMNEAVNLARTDVPALVEALDRPLDKTLLGASFQTISAKTLGDATGPRKKHKNGVYDAMQDIAREMGMPRLYRFFEGWMKSDLDWDEDAVEEVLAYRESDA